MEKKKLVRSKPLLSVEEQERAVELLNSGKRTADAPALPAAMPADAKAVYSYNVKLDAETERMVKSHIARTGQNMKGFFQMAVREYLEKHAG